MEQQRPLTSATVVAVVTALHMRAQMGVSSSNSSSSQADSRSSSGNGSQAMQPPADQPVSDLTSSTAS
jgi:hypothetical protein